MFECQFSMDGLSFAATDALGHVILFGFGDDQPYQQVRVNVKYTLLVMQKNYNVDAVLIVRFV